MSLFNTYMFPSVFIALLSHLSKFVFFLVFSLGPLILNLHNIQISNYTESRILPVKYKYTHTCYIHLNTHSL
jgi:hypothetical protein